MSSGTLSSRRRRPIRGSSPSPQPWEAAPGSAHLPNVFRTGSTTWGSPNSMPSPSQPGWRWPHCDRWWPSTRRFTCGPGNVHTDTMCVAMDAATLLETEGIPLTVVNARYIKPLDPRLESWARRHPCVLTLEDNVMTGGFGSAVSEVLAPLAIPVTVLAVPDAFIGQGTQVELLKQLELDATGVAARIRRMLASPEALPAPPASQAASPA